MIRPRRRTTCGRLLPRAPPTGSGRLDGTRVEGGIHHDALHEVGVVLLAEVIAPFQRRMLGGKDGILIFFIDAIAPFLADVLAGEQRLVTGAYGGYFLFECCCHNRGFMLLVVVLNIFLVG